MVVGLNDPVTPVGGLVSFSVTEPGEPATAWADTVAVTVCAAVLVTTWLCGDIDMAKSLPPVLLTYGRLVTAMSPTFDTTGPGVGLVSPFQSCQAQKPPLGVSNPSGWVPGGETTTYCALRLSPGLVLLKCEAARTASSPICCSVAASGALAALSSQTPASAPPVGYPTCAELAGQVVAPLAMPSQYWVITPDHCSPAAPMPFISCCRRAAIPTPSLEYVVLPLASVPGSPHWVPQKMRYTRGLPVVTPMPSTAPP